MAPNEPVPTAETQNPNATVCTYGESMSRTFDLLRELDRKATQEGLDRTAICSALETFTRDFLLMHMNDSKLRNLISDLQYGLDARPAAQCPQVVV